MAIKIGEENLFDLIGGRPMLDKVHKIFYDKIYADAWISKYFKGIEQNIIEVQQSDFMSQIMGGPAIYCGKLPVPAHRHMFITEELFDLRTRFLTEAMQEAGLDPENQQRWLKIDQAFKHGIVKKALSDCSLRFNTDDILDFSNQNKKTA